MATATETERLQHIRKAVSEDAAKGTSPSRGEFARLLDEAFSYEGGAEALARYEEQAAAIQAERQQKARYHNQERKIAHMTKRVLQQWHLEEQAESSRQGRGHQDPRTGHGRELTWARATSVRQRQSS
jgi:hypothetical protein